MYVIEEKAVRKTLGIKAFYNLSIGQTIGQTIGQSIGQRF